MIVRNNALISFIILLSLAVTGASSSNSTQALTITALLEEKHEVLPGDTIQLALYLESQLALGGIDFVVYYDNAAFSFVSAVKDTGLPNWESFYVNHDLSGHTVRITSIADVVNGPDHPREEDFYPHGTATTLTLAVSEDWFGGEDKAPVSFLWRNCGSNAVSNKIGDSLIVLRRLYDFDGGLIWDESDDVNFPESARIDSIGLPDSCLAGTNNISLVLDLRNGLVTRGHLCGDSDANGLINISDVVYLIAYIFNQGPEPQPYEAGDVDCNSLVNISDAVYLVSFIFGSGLPPCENCP